MATTQASTLKTSIIQPVLATQAGLGALVLRVPVGLILAAHGSQKLFGWLGGYGLEGTGQWMASIGFEPGVLMAFLAGSAEFFGGILLALGLLTRPAALVTAFTMLMAITFHWPNGLFASNGGYEFALTLFAATLSLLFSGGGRLSLDQQLASRV